jgi:hypothetical protein
MRLQNTYAQSEEDIGIRCIMEDGTPLVASVNNSHLLHNYCQAGCMLYKCTAAAAVEVSLRRLGALTKV